MKLSTKAIHVGHDVDSLTGAVALPLYLSTTFERDPDGGYPRGYVYTRLDNPNRMALEQSLCSLEGGKAAAAFSSGLAAINALLQGLSGGDHIVVSDELYHGTVHIIKDIYGPWGLQATFVDTRVPELVQQAVRPNTRLVYIETPSNPTLKITDIRAIAGIARAAGAKCVCDNTWATPILQRPLELGADLVIQSTTKYHGGHSDVLGGALVSKDDDEFFARIRMIQRIGGAVPAPFDCWLISRGIQTLPCRMKAQTRIAAQIAAFLESKPQVEKVYYPGLASHEGHAVAARQMDGFGAMLSFQVRGGREAALAVTGKVKIITPATSLGGVESLIEHRKSIEGPDSRTPDNLLRLSVGLEDVEDLKTDLETALAG
ncbi:trans-sulfuration enzyme family protein [Acetonema longum]|uniref:Cystathionine gamma-synthase n=1 Tax=Acetonema longum DSM 6540 TaxID=1009370 RepID=F7NQ10_9FIRM|nr:aminotransferase class V-fold PLP-dependent enzyme [Acetonema longum]EGO61887.1 cystathionine gamma-synthase [Acetonema longum DSM 6540]